MRWDGLECEREEEWVSERVIERKRSDPSIATHCVCVCAHRECVDRERKNGPERKMISIPYRIATVIYSMWLNSITVKFTIQLKQIFWFARSAKCLSLLSVCCSIRLLAFSFRVAVSVLALRYSLFATHFSSTIERNDAHRNCDKNDTTGKNRRTKMKIQR